VSYSFITMDLLQEGMGIVPLDVPGSNTNAVEKSGRYDSGDGIGTPNKSPKVPRPVRNSNWFNLVFMQH
jgi:hypothetical protein